MALRSLINVLRALFRPPAPEPDGSSDDGAAALGRHAFDSRLRLFADRLVDGADHLLAGSLELVGLEDLQVALGSNWAAVAERAKELAELELQMQLGPDDIYRTYSDTVFLICFATLDKAAADRRAREIAAHIRAKLVEHIPEVAQALRVEHCVAQVDREVFKDASIPVADSLFAALRTVKAEAEATCKRFKSSLLQGAQVTFYPACHIAKRMLAFNRCVLDLSASGTELEQFQAVATIDQLDRVLTELDLLVLTRSIEALHKALASKRTGFYFLVPVTYRTVSNAAGFEEYAKLLSMMPEPYRRFLALEISAVPPSAPLQHIAAIVKRLRPSVNGVSIEVAPGSEHAQQIVDQQPWAIAIDLQDKGARRYYSDGLKMILSAANDAGVSAMAHGANSVALATACAEAGFTYVDGPAIHAATPDPKRISPLKALQPRRAASASASMRGDAGR